MSHFKPYSKDNRFVYCSCSAWCLEKNVILYFRAQRRIQGEDVFGNKIKVLNSASRSQPGNLRSYGGRKQKGTTPIESNYQQQQFGQYVTQLPSDLHNSQFLGGNLMGNPWKSVPVSGKKMKTRFFM